MAGLDLWQSVKGLVVSQYGDSPMLLRLLETCISAFQGAEDAIAAFKDGFDISTATGAWLDVVAKLVGVTRSPGETDESLRERALLASMQDTAGTPDYAISGARDISGDAAPQYLEEAPATFFVYTPGGSQLSRGRVRGLSPAGVLGLPGAAIAFADGAFMATADGRKMLAVAQDKDKGN